MIQILQELGLVSLGIATAAFGTLIGLGGGILLVPVFLFLGFPAPVAAGTSLAVVCANGVSGAMSFLRQRRVDVRSGLIFAASGIPGAWIGALLDRVLPERLFTALLALLLLWIGLHLLHHDFRTRARDVVRRQAERADAGVVPPGLPGFLTRDFVDAHGVRHHYRYSAAGGIAVSFLSGFLVSTFGIGGGLVAVPAMVYAFGFPPHVAAATSTFVIAITSLFGTASHVLYDDVRWSDALLVGAGAVIGAQVGARLAHRIAARPLMRLLAVAVLAMSARLVWIALT